MRFACGASVRREGSEQPDYAACLPIAFPNQAIAAASSAPSAVSSVSGTTGPGPTMPQTIGKAERFLRTRLAEWAYQHSYPTSVARASALPDFLRYYNQGRCHMGINGLTPLQRLAQRRSAEARPPRCIGPRRGQWTGVPAA